MATGKLVESGAIDDVMMRLVLGEPRTYGLGSPVLAEQRFAFVRAALYVASADGVLSDAERDTLLGRAVSYGVTRGDVERLMKLDVASTKLADVFTPQMRPLAKPILYEAILVSSIDGFGPREREAAERMARTLGVDLGFVPAIEGQIAVERAVRGMRLALVSDPESAAWPTKVPAIGGAPSADPLMASFEDVARRDRYGMVGPLTGTLQDKIPRAMLIVAGADGVVTTSEMMTLLGVSKAMGIPREKLIELESFDHRHAQIDDHVKDLPKALRRVVLFGAINTAWTDGFADQERASATKCARLMGLDTSLVALIERHLAVESAVRQSRLRLLSPALP